VTVKITTALTASLRGGSGLLQKLLAALPPAVAEDLMAHATLRSVAKGDILLERGVHSDVVAYVLDGTLAMVQVLDDGRQHIVGLLVPTDIYGRLFDGPSSYRIEALSDGQILSVPRPTLEVILRDNPEAERLFLVHLLDEVDAAREWLLLISGRKAINRLAAFLDILFRRTRFGRASGPVRVHVPLSRKDLAHYLGTRPETLSRAFRELELMGALRMIDPYHFELLDEEALVMASGDDLTFQDESNRKAV